VSIILLFVPAPATAPRNCLARQGFAVGVGRTTDPLGARCWTPPHEGRRRGSPTRRQGCNHLSRLPAGRRGRRHPPRLAQDRVPLGQGRQASLPEDPGRRPPPLPRSRDPQAGPGTSRGGDHLRFAGSWQGTASRALGRRSMARRGPHRTNRTKTGRPGSQAPIGKGSAMAETRNLYRSRSNRQVTGLCAW
jgi:hypothetical protein